MHIEKNANVNSNICLISPHLSNMSVNIALGTFMVRNLYKEAQNDLQEQESAAKTGDLDS